MVLFDEGAVKGESKAEFVYRVLRDDILSGQYAPGTALYIRELSTQLGVSRTPVKEAISRLAIEDYVELLPNRCAIISRISATEIIELLELRESLECSAAYYAALRHTKADVLQLQQIEQRHHQIPVESKNELAACDREFHMAIAKSAYNHQMYQMIEKVFFKLTRVESVITQAHLPDSLVQHNNVLEAIQEGNAEAARRYMSEHDQDILTAIRLFQYQNIHLFRT